MNHKNFTRARAIATLSDFPKIHIGCIAIYHGNIIGIGYNTVKTHPIQKHYNCFRIQSDAMLPKMHAEISCVNSIKHLDINFSKVKLYIYRIANDRPHRMSRPCPSCMAAIKDLGIRDIYYTTDDGYVHERLDQCITSCDKYDNSVTGYSLTEK